MQLLRPAAARGRVATAAGERRHAFSSATFHDPAWPGWSTLRVASEDRLAPGLVVQPARLANIEVLRLVVAGRVDCDGAGGGVVLAAGEWQWLGAGHGHDDAGLAAHGPAPAHLLQFWLQPDRLNAVPAQARRPAAAAGGRDGWTLVASPDGDDGGLPIRSPAWVRETRLPAGATRDAPRDSARRHWLQVVDGAVEVDGRPLAAGDALAIAGEGGALPLRGAGPGDAHLLWFDLPG